MEEPKKKDFITVDEVKAMSVEEITEKMNKMHDELSMYKACYNYSNGELEKIKDKVSKLSVLLDLSLSMVK